MSDSAAPAEEASVSFNIKSGSSKWTLSLPLATTIATLKAKLATEEYANVPVSSQRLIYSGKVLKDVDTLSSCNVKDGNAMHLVKSAPSNQRQNPANQSSTIPNAGTPQSTGVPQNLAAGTGNDPLAGLTGARYAGFAGLPSLESLANPPTPEEMIRRLQDPNFAQQMNEALQNPQMIDMMINANPQLRAMGPQARQMLQSEHFRRMMTNPEVLRSMMALQGGAGMDPFGGFGGGGQSAFPAPGVTNPSEQQTNTSGNPAQPSQPNAASQQAMLDLLQGMQANPAQGGRAPNSTDSTQQNPFLSLLNPPTASEMQAQSGAADSQTPGQPNSSGQFHSGLHPLLDQLMFTGPSGQPNYPRGPMNEMFARVLAERLANDPSGAFGPNSPLGQLGLPGAGGLGGFGGTQQPADTRPPEERFATQLRQLNEMGFHNFDQNVTALSRSGGDVNGALEYLFSQPQ